MKKRIAMAMTALALVGVLAGCGGGSGSGSSKETVVEMKSMVFAPKTLEVKAGTTVKFVNKDQVDHSVWEGKPDSGNYLFKSPDFSTNGEYSYTFEKPGTYELFCNTGGHHLIGMTMKVVVK